jgi:hypothetical protein
MGAFPYWECTHILDMEKILNKEKLTEKGNRRRIHVLGNRAWGVFFLWP